LERKKLVLCDPEMDYAQQMAAFLAKDKDFPWEVIVCSDWKEAQKCAGQYAPQIWLVAESLTEEELPDISSGQLVLLNESGVTRFSQVHQIDKYQEAENVRKELLRLLAQKETRICTPFTTEKRTRIIGFYSPVRGCLQTNAAITYGQLLAGKAKVLYLHLGCYAGLPELDDLEPEGDLGALVYYLGEEEGRFWLHLKGMVRSLESWDYIPAMRNGADLPGILEEEWMNLLERCRALKEYDYIVLDIREEIQGLFEVLLRCDRIFTLENEDVFSQRKLEKYHYVLERNGYGEVQNKTKSLVLPDFGRLPGALVEYTRGTLAEYLSNLLAEEGEKHG